MTTAERIHKLGFRRWYERALIESHAYLVTAFLGMVATFAAIEMIGNRDGPGRFLLGIAVASFGTAIVAYGIRRYYRLIVLAQTLGERATCTQCKRYASFDVVASSAGAKHGDDEIEDTGTVWLRVKCRQCGHEWTL